MRFSKAGVADGVKDRIQSLRAGLGLVGAGFQVMMGSKAPGTFLSQVWEAIQARWGEPPKRNSKQWLEMYGKNPRLRPVYKIAKDVAASQWHLYVERGKEKVELQDHPLIRLLERPNPRMTGNALMYLTQVYLSLRGEAFWLQERNGLGSPSELWPIPPYWVVETPTMNKPYYRVDFHNGSQVLVPAEDIIMLVEPDPVNPYGRGLGSAEGIGDEIETDEYMAKWAKRFFWNNATPPVVFEAPNIQKEQAERIKEEWMERYAGYWNAHKPAILPWEAKIHELGKGQKEMDFVESRRYIRDTAMQHFMIPPELMGVIENSNRATIDAAYYIYAANVLKPCLDLIQEHIQVFLVPQFDDKLIFEFDDPVPANKEFRLQQANDGLKQGALTVDEWRERNGFDRLEEGGDVIYVPIGSVPTPVKQVKGRLKGKMTRGLTPEQKTAIWWMFDKAARSQESNLQRALKRYFQAQQDEINRNLEELLGEKAKAVYKDVDNLLQLLANWQEQYQALLDLLRQFWDASARDGWQAVQDIFDLPVSYELINPRVVQWMETNGAEKVKDITETTKRALAQTLAEGIAQGDGVAKLRDRVSEVFRQAKVVRAETIARTETHNAVSIGTFETYRAGRVEQKEWLATRDSRVRDSHISIDREVRPIDQPFSNGLMYPGAPGPPGEVINCRCALLPVIEGVED